VRWDRAGAGTAGGAALPGRAPAAPPALPSCCCRPSLVSRAARYSSMVRLTASNWGYGHGHRRRIAKLGKKAKSSSADASRQRVGTAAGAPPSAPGCSHPGSRAPAEAAPRLQPRRLQGRSWRRGCPGPHHGAQRPPAPAAQGCAAAACPTAAARCAVRSRRMRPGAGSGGCAGWRVLTGGWSGKRGLVRACSEGQQRSGELRAATCQPGAVRCRKASRRWNNTQRLCIASPGQPACP
jgi:hypothetical protein